MPHHTLNYEPTQQQMDAWKRDRYALWTATERWRMWVQDDVDCYGERPPEAPAAGIMGLAQALDQWARHFNHIDGGPLIRIIHHLQVAAHPWTARHDTSAPGGTHRERRVPPSKDELDHVFSDCLRILNRLDDGAAIVCGMGDRGAATDGKGGEAVDTDGSGRQLNETQENALIVLLKRKAFTAAARVRAEDIACEAGGRYADVNGYKRPLSELVKAGLLNSGRGRGSGYWLTPSGQREAEHIKRVRTV